jgi:hypothetical protein
VDELLVQVQLLAGGLWLMLKIFGPGLLILFGPQLWHRFRGRRGVQQESTATPATEPDHVGTEQAG